MKILVLYLFALIILFTILMAISKAAGDADKRAGYDDVIDALETLKEVDELTDEEFAKVKKEFMEKVSKHDNKQQ